MGQKNQAVTATSPITGMALVPAADTAPQSAVGTASRFGVAHAIVILGFLAATVLLRLATKMSVEEIAVLLAVGGGLPVVVLVVIGMRGLGGRASSRDGRLLRRVLTAVLTPGSGN